MAVKGEVKSEVVFTNDLFCGFVKIEEVLSVNPTAKERAELMGYEFDEEKHKEPEYTGESDEGNSKVDLVFYLRGHNKEMKPLTHRVSLENKEIVFKDEGAGTEKYKWINQLGQTFVCFEESELPGWFTNFQAWNDLERKFEPTEHKKHWRKALIGEDKLALFVREALGKVNQNDPDGEISFNMKQLFKGNVKELLQDLRSEYFVPFVTLVHVSTNKEGDKQYQNLYIGSNTFQVPSLPFDALKFIRNGCNFPGKLKKRWDKWKEDAEKPSYGATGFYAYEEIRKYNPAEDIVTSPDSKPVSESGNDY